LQTELVPQPKYFSMKIRMFVVALLVAVAACASEFDIASSDVPQAVLDSFSGKYPTAKDVKWEVEKEDGKLYFEAEFEIDGKEKEAHFRSDGTFTKEE
jgi:hypothetical protein